jgi:ribonucleoside-diphosphate reductase alpha chain
MIDSPTALQQSEIPRPEFQSSWSKNSVEILEKRYLKKDQCGNLLENPDDRFWSVACDIGIAESRWNSPEKTMDYIQKFYRMMMERKFTPSTPTLANAGKHNGQQFSACYVLPVLDSLPEIFDAVKYAAIIHKSGGGTGFSFSRLRPKNDKVGSTGGVASGPVSFMKAIDACTEQVKQGSYRRGANMGILRVDHPDVLEFIDCKLSGGISNFNISLAITDEFMNALRDGRNYDLISPRTNQKVGQLSAKEVFSKIISAAWKTGDPGLIFIDRINNSSANPIPSCGPVEATNPCGEQPLYPYESCNLGSINMGMFIKDGTVDYEELERVIRLSVRFLDNVIERNPFPLPQIDEIVKKNRRIGLGVMGWADMLFQLEIPYQSEKALSLANTIMEFIHEVAHSESGNLATERGSFPRWEESIYKDQYPLRNSTVLTIAPTGTISIVAACSSGIEPIFGLYFKHRLGLEFFNPFLQQVLRKHGYWSEELQEHVRQHGSIADTQLPTELKEIFKTAHEIPPEWHVQMQAVFQKHTDNAVSKTINLPNSATPEDVSKAYLLAYKLGCMGITVYRDGCKNEQVLTHGTLDKQHSTEQPIPIKSRPQILSGQTLKVRSPFGSVFVTINRNGNNEPFEIFLNVGKAGSDITADAEAIGRLCSLLLRIPSPIPEEERLQSIITHLAGIGGARDAGFGPNRVRSVPDAVAVALKQFSNPPVPDVKDQQAQPRAHAERKTQETGILCPECGSATIKQEGCEKCACGWSSC